MGANSVPIHSHNSSHINSVFDRIEWPEISAKSSLNAQQNSSASHRRNPSSAQSAGALRDQRIVRFQNSNRQPKDKGLLLEEPNKENESLVSPVSCPICVASNGPRSSCKSWISCFTCRSFDHIAAHCRARWRKLSSSMKQSTSIKEINSASEKTNFWKKNKRSLPVGHPRVNSRVLRIRLISFPAYTKALCLPRSVLICS
jgi:hypothetical protein